MKEEITPSEEELLTAIGETVNYSLGGHYSKQEISKRLSPNTKNNPKRMKRIDRAYTKLRTKQLIQKHPSEEMTYGLTRNGLNYLRELKKGNVK
ncbi:MAG: hypothetical protein HeimC2_40220 [Candidatus Heimdallarchaeota archaeon LC_2]|nr:MAG: hypothetical protein HeimC2_40220 [Candidatus Heimdallarchaeota archaeon LC_2]